MNEQEFQFVASEEASGTSVLSVSKDIAFWTRGDELVLVLFTWSISQVQEAMAIEIVGVGKNVGVFHQDWTHADECAFWDFDAVA